MNRFIMSIIEQGYRNDLSCDAVLEQIHEAGYTDVTWELVADVYSDIECIEEGK